MNGDELLYKRLALNVNCRSSEIAYSYLDGRVDAQEIFEKDEKKLSFQQILASDEIVRVIICKAGDVRLSQPAGKKFDNFSSRYALYKKIVLRGDDSIASLLLQLDKKDQQIENLQAEKSQLQQNLDFYGKQRDALNNVCVSTLTALKDFSVILQGLRNNFSDCDDAVSCQYSRLIQMEQSAVMSVTQSLQQNHGNISDKIDESLPQKIREVELIDSLQKENEQNIANRKRYLEDFSRKKQVELDELSRLHQEHIDSENKNLMQKKQQCKEELISLRQEIEKEIAEKTNLLMDCMSQTGEFYSAIKHNASNLFKANNCVFPGKNIPDKVMFNAIKKCNGEIAPRHIIAIYDDSFSKDGTKGILVSYHAFYLFGNFQTKKYLLHHNNILEIDIKTNTPKIITGIIWGIISIILFCIDQDLSIVTGVISIVISAIVIFNSPSYKKVKYRDSEIAAFSGRNADEFKKFIQELNSLSSACHWSSEKIQEIRKVEIPFP